MSKLLVVDDDTGIRNLLSLELANAGFEPVVARGGGEARALLQLAPVDLILLDLSMPGEDGLTLCRHLRGRSSTPIIMLTARRDPVDRIVGLEIGADDYVTKPFDLRELIARIRNVLRRTRAAVLDEHMRKKSRARFAGWTLDIRERHLLDEKGQVISLSGLEFQLLRVLLTHASKILTRRRLMELATGRRPQSVERAVDVHVSRLRCKLRDECASAPIIRTVRNQGYVLTAEVSFE